MADKSLSTIAQELWQGFGRNPRNAETFEAMANMNPIMAAYRGAKTLSNVNLEPLKQAYLNEAYGRNDPNVNREAGRQLGNIAMGSLDVLPVVPVAKAGLKAAAPHLAEGAVNLAEKYGLSPTMSIVPPEGNLNLRPRIEAGKIKGPEKQRAGDMLRQLKNKPGISKEALDEIRQKIVAEHGSTNKVMTKSEFEQFVEPSKYEKVDLKSGSDTGDFEHYLDMAHDEVDMHDALDLIGVPKRFQNDALMVEYGDIEFNELDPESRRELSRIYGIDGSMDREQIMARLEDDHMNAWHEAIQHRAEYLQDTEALEAQGYPYEGVQRLVASQPEGSYFEFGVTHPSQTGDYRHYRSEEAPEGLIGHVRGSHLIDPTGIYGGVETLPNSYIVEEIQSDAQKIADQTGHLRQVHGTLAKAAIQDAIERGADRIYFPTSYSIGSVRARPNTDYASIYDQAIHNEALTPIIQKYGVQLEPQMSKQVFADPNWVPGSDKAAYSLEEVPYFHKLELTPELKERIQLEGQQTPGYDEGGLVDKAARLVRKGQYGLAKMVGLGPEVEFATEIPEHYYPANEQHNARGDAMRHILLQAQLANRSPMLAKAVGWAHENLSGPQGDAEKAMDEYNDRIGREIGLKAKDKADMVYQALQAVDSRRAKTLTKDQMEEGYAEGGLVYNDDEISKMADQLFGV